MVAVKCQAGQDNSTKLARREHHEQSFVLLRRGTGQREPHAPPDFASARRIGALAFTGITPAAAAPPQAEAPTPTTNLQGDPAKKWKGSGLGSLYPFIKQVQDKLPRVLLTLKFAPRTSKLGRRRRAPGSLICSCTTRSCDPAATALERVDKGDYIREYLRFHTTPDIEVPAYFLIPKRAKFPVPAVVALHCHGGFYYFLGRKKIVETDNEHPVLLDYRKTYYDGLSYPATLARNGFAVIGVHMFYFGERRLILDSDLAEGTNDRSKQEPTETIQKLNARNGGAEGYFLRNMLMSGFTWAGVLAWDDMRTIDYLQTRPEVDAKRIACVGLSVGGYRSNFLAGLDPRIKAACVAGWMTSSGEIRSRV